MHLRERAVHVRHVLEHLNGQDGVESPVLHWERGRVGLVEGNVVMLLRPPRSDREHLRAAVHPDDRSCVAHLLEQLGDVEAGAAADVEYPLAR